MTRPEGPIGDVGEWIAKAEEDFGVASHLLADEVPFFVAIGFHCQQACEKFLKAVLVHHGADFPKTHDLILLTKLVASAAPDLARVLPPMDSLNVYGVEARYPSELAEPSRRMVQADFEATREVRAEVLAALRDARG